MGSAFFYPSWKARGYYWPNGAGKSTLLKALLGIIKPLAGRIEFLGQPYKKVRKSIAYVPQRSAIDLGFSNYSF